VTTRKTFDPGAVSLAFWRQDEVQTALARHDVGALFRMFLAAHPDCTQTQLALLTEHDRSEISNLVRGTRSGRIGDIDVLTRIADGLQMPDDSRVLAGLAPASVLMSSINVVTTAGTAATPRPSATVQPWHLRDRAELGSASVPKSQRRGGARNHPPDRLPPDVRDHPAVITACGERDIGMLFRIINNLTNRPAQFTLSHIARRCGLTPTRVSEYMNGQHNAMSVDVIVRVANGLGIPTARFGLTDTASLEGGDTPWPSASYGAASRAVYGEETDAELGLSGMSAATDSCAPHDMAVPSAHAPWLPTTPSGEPHLGAEEADDMYRRELLRATLAAGGWSVAAPAIAALEQIGRCGSHWPQPEHNPITAAAYESAAFGQRAGATNIHPGTLEQIDADIERLARAYLTQPLTELINEMRYERNMVFTALEGRQYPSQTRQLYLNAAQLCGLMASASSDLGHHDAARTHARTAAICAELAGDPSTSAWIAATQSLIEFWDGQPTQAVLRARAGREYVTCDIDALRLYSLEARANARLGDVKSVREAVSHVTRILDRADASAHRSIFDFPDANALRCAGSSYLWLNEFAEAQNALSRALEIFEAHPDGGSYAHVAVTRIDLSLAYLGSHDFDAAHETLRPVLELSPERRLSGTLRRFDDLRAALARPYYGKLPAARDLADQLNVLSSEVGG
jgi:transcriptional regulator with XRE-family HTH domain/tetratricopeptide (TPR) repeat protein